MNAFKSRIENSWRYSGILISVRMVEPAGQGMDQLTCVSHQIIYAIPLLDYDPVTGVSIRMVSQLVGSTGRK